MFMGRDCNRVEQGADCLGKPTSSIPLWRELTGELTGHARHAEPKATPGPPNNPAHVGAGQSTYPGAPIEFGPETMLRVLWDA
jgi:hypothetical protein